MSDTMRRMTVTLIALATAFAMMFALTPASVADDTGGSVDMYRMYNPNSGEHFYTGNGVERDQLRGVGWKYEGVGWVAPAHSNTPVYRLYNPNASDHHYTTSAGERDSLVRSGWRDEGIGWYSSDTNRSFIVYHESDTDAATNDVPLYTVAGTPFPAYRVPSKFTGVEQWSA
ncbi:hypothetical protein JS528_11120, partial [Bifidobacterium sp. MA2]|nr:hypothetical protein [Bifidobacterium santillanense]